MASVTLQPMKLDVFTATFSEETETIAEQAREKLGYRKLDGFVNRSFPLLEALTTLNITPFSTASVEKYKQSKRKTSWYSGTKQWVFGWLPLGLAMIAGAWQMTRLARYAPTDSGTEFICVFLALMLTISGLLTLFIAAVKDNGIGHGKRSRLDWDSTGLSSYRGDVPLHVLSKALEIKNAVPTAGFTVHYLVEYTDRRERPLPDPFLQVTAGDESYFVEVWDEKKYEETLLK